MITVPCTVDDFVRMSLAGRDSARVDIDVVTGKLKARERFFYTPERLRNVEEAAKDPIAAYKANGWKWAVVNLLAAPVALAVWRLIYNTVALFGNAILMLTELSKGVYDFAKWTVTTRTNQHEVKYDIHFRMAGAHALMVMRNIKEAARNLIRVIPLGEVTLGILFDFVGENLLKIPFIKKIVARSMIFEINAKKSLDNLVEKYDHRTDRVGYRSKISIEKTNKKEEVVQFVVDQMKEQEGWLRVPELIIGSLSKAGMDALGSKVSSHLQKNADSKRKKVALSLFTSLCKHSTRIKQEEANLTYAPPHIKDKKLLSKITAGMDRVSQKLLNSDAADHKTFILMAQLIIGAIFLAALEYLEAKAEYAPLLKDLKKILSVIADQMGTEEGIEANAIYSLGSTLVSSLVAQGFEAAQKQMLEKEKQIKVLTTVLMMGMYLWERYSDQGNISISQLWEIIRSNSDKVEGGIDHFWKNIAKPKLKKEMMAQYDKHRGGAEGEKALVGFIMDTVLDAFWNKVAAPQIKEVVDQELRGVSPEPKKDQASVDGSNNWHMFEMMLGVLAKTAAQELGPKILAQGLAQAENAAVKGNEHLVKMSVFLTTVNSLIHDTPGHGDPFAAMGQLILNTLFANAYGQVDKRTKNPILRFELKQVVDVVKALAEGSKELTVNALCIQVLRAILSAALDSITSKLKDPKLVARLEDAMAKAKEKLDQEEIDFVEFGKEVLSQLLKAGLEYATVELKEKEGDSVTKMKLALLLLGVKLTNADTKNPELFNSTNKLLESEIIGAGLKAFGTYMIDEYIQSAAIKAAIKTNAQVVEKSLGLRFQEGLFKVVWNWFIKPKLQNQIVDAIACKKKPATEKRDKSIPPSSYMFGLL